MNPTIRRVHCACARNLLIVALFVGTVPAGSAPVYGDVTLLEKVDASDGQSGDIFGISVGVDGDRAVVGSLWDDDNGFDSGSAYVFERVGSQWVQQQKLLAPDGAANDVFGRSVDIDGDIIIVGTNAIDDLGFDSGGAYVYEFDGSQWVFTTKLLAADGGSNDHAGWRVDLEGNTAIVSGLDDDSNGVDSGAAYIFVRDDGGTWFQQAKLLPSDGAADDQFGHDVAISGDVALVGAYKNDDDGESSGSAYFFMRDAQGTWTQQQKVTAFDANAGYHFGRFVDLDGDTAVIGSPFWWPLNFGAAYIFEYNEELWTQTEMLTSDVLTTQENFASDVAIEGDLVVTGSLFIQGNNAGKAYAFRRSNGAWSLQSTILAADGAIGDGFGRHVAISGEFAIISANGDDDNGPDSGSAYIFDLAPALGDINFDGVVDLNDVAPFVNLLTSGDFQVEADINQDGVVDLLDVQPFVDLLSG